MDVIAPYLNYIIIALVVVAALILLSVLTRTFNSRVRGRRGKRLGVSEYRELDQTRRLMLVRRDNVEHLILVGGGQSLVIEQNIYDEDDDTEAEDYASAPVQHQTPPIRVQEEESFRPRPVPQPVPEPKFQPAPRAPSFEDRAPNVRPIHRTEPNFGPADDKY